MTHKQFVFWLKGYTEGKTKLKDTDLKLIKDNLSLASNPYTFATSSISYPSPSVFYCGTSNVQQ